LVENQIQKDISVVFDVWMPFCKHFSMDYGGFPWPREECKGNVGDVVSRGELVKTSLIASTHYVFSKW